MLRKEMDSTMNIGVLIAICLTYGIYDTLGLLGCGGIVKIDKRLAIYLTSQYGEILTYFLYINHIICRHGIPHTG
jgi:hypothetical protein